MVSGRILCTTCIHAEYLAPDTLHSTQIVPTAGYQITHFTTLDPREVTINTPSRARVRIYRVPARRVLRLRDREPPATAHTHAWPHLAALHVALQHILYDTHIMVSDRILYNVYTCHVSGARYPHTRRVLRLSIWPTICTTYLQSCQVM